MADIFQTLLIIVMLTISLSAFFLVMGALFANRVNKSQYTLNQTPGRAFGVGIVNALFFAVVVLVLFSLAEKAEGIAKIILTAPALLLSTLLAVLLAVGLSALVNELGLRLFPQAGGWKQTALGSIVLSFACALPFAGWFLLFPCIVFLAIGAAILGFVQRGL